MATVDRTPGARPPERQRENLMSGHRLRRENWPRANLGRLGSSKEWRRARRSRLSHMAFRAQTCELAWVKFTARGLSRERRRAATHETKRHVSPTWMAGVLDAVVSVVTLTGLAGCADQ
jgi:hypothetical protein